MAFKKRNFQLGGISGFTVSRLCNYSSEINFFLSRFGKRSSSKRFIFQRVIEYFVHPRDLILVTFKWRSNGRDFQTALTNPNDPKGQPTKRSRVTAHRVLATNKTRNCRTGCRWFPRCSHLCCLAANFEWLNICYAANPPSWIYFWRKLYLFCHRGRGWASWCHKSCCGWLLVRAGISSNGVFAAGEHTVFWTGCQTCSGETPAGCHHYKPKIWLHAPH